MITISILIFGVLVAILGLLAAIASMVWVATERFTTITAAPGSEAPVQIAGSFKQREQL